MAGRLDVSTVKRDDELWTQEEVMEYGLAGDDENWAVHIVETDVPFAIDDTAVVDIEMTRAIEEIAVLAESAEFKEIRVCWSDKFPQPEPMSTLPSKVEEEQKVPSYTSDTAWFSKRFVDQTSGTVPGPPQVSTISDVTCTSCVVSYQPPLCDGGSPITGYHVEWRERDSVIWFPVNDKQVFVLTMEVTDLLKGRSYEFRVAAENRIGIGEFSVASPSIVAKNPRITPIESISPAIIEPLRNQTVLSPETASFSALIRIGEPTAEIDWFKAGKPLNADNKKYQIAFDNDTAMLEIFNCEAVDAAEYSIVAFNNVAKVASHATLTVNDLSRSATTPANEPQSSSSSATNTQGASSRQKVLGRNTKIARPCPYCSTMQTNLSRHIASKHKSLECVSNASRLPKESRNKAFAAMKKDGILLHNKEQMTCNSPQYLREKRQGVDSSKLVMCDTCTGFFSKTYFARHRKSCMGDTAVIPKPLPIQLLSVTDQGPVTSFYTEIVARFHQDEIGDVCRTDGAIKMYGQRMYQKAIGKQDKELEVKKSVMCDMRRLARLYIEFVQQCNMAGKVIKESTEMLKRSHFEELSKAVTTISTSEDDQVKAGLKIALFYLVKKFAKINKGNFLIHLDDERAIEIDRFTEVFNLNQPLLFGDATYLLHKTAMKNCEGLRNFQVRRREEDFDVEPNLQSPPASNGPDVQFQLEASNVEPDFHHPHEQQSHTSTGPDVHEGQSASAQHPTADQPEDPRFTSTSVDDVQCSSRQKRRRIRIQSDSDSDDCSVKPSQRLSGQRKPWSDELLENCRQHFSYFITSKINPNYKSIREAKKKFVELVDRSDAAIKSRIIHLIKTGR